MALSVTLTQAQALWFLPAVLPLCLAVAWTDLSRMKIPNWTTDGLALGFVLLGLFALPAWSDYLWRFAHFGVMLAIGIALNAARVMGAGDSKFLAAAAPYVALPDAQLVLFMLGGVMLLGVAVHRTARAIPALRTLAPDWESWKQGKRFPLGFPLGLTLIAYMVLPFVA